MTIRYLLDGFSRVSTDTECVAESQTHFYIIKDSQLYGIAKDLVVSAFYANSNDSVPDVITYAQAYAEQLTAPPLTLAYHLESMETVH